MKRLLSLFLTASMLFPMSPTVLANTIPPETIEEGLPIDAPLAQEERFRQKLEKENEFLSPKREAETYAAPAVTTASGKCGPNLTWTFADNTLTISGSGAMTNYIDSRFPWEEFGYRSHTLVIGEGVTSLAETFFNELYNLTNIVVEDGNTTFSSMDGVLFNKAKTVLIKYPSEKTDSSYAIPDGVVTIREYAFEDVSALTSVTVPASVSNFEDYYFYHISSLTSITVDAANPFFSSKNGVLFDKNMTTLLRYPSAKTDTSYTVPEGVRTIPTNSCINLDYLRDIVLPASLTKLSNYAFSPYDPLRSISVDADNPVYSAQDGVLFDKNMTTLIFYPQAKTAESYSVPAGISAISDNAFGQVQALTSIHLPQTLTNAGDWPFETCRNLTAITVDDENPSYTAEDGVLFNKAKTELYRYPSAKADEAYTVPETVQYIDYDAFLYCANLKTLTIPAGVKSINYNFRYCTVLESITVVSSNPMYSSENGILFNADKTELICYPSGKTGDSYTVPDSVKLLCRYAFSDTDALTSLVLPASVRMLEHNAIFRCDALTGITVHGSPEFEENSFQPVRSCTIYGLTGSSSETYVKEYNDILSFVSIGTYTPEVIASGMVEAFTWTLDSLGHLSISGTGILFDNYSTKVPWANYGEQIRSITIGEGITELSQDVFRRCYYLKKVTLPKSIVYIEPYTFQNTHNLSIAGYNGTCAELYANAYGIPFDCLDKNTEIILSSGTFGDTIEWTLYDTAKLVLNGSGEIPIVSWDEIPWYDYNEYITEIVLGDGITSIPYSTFSSCDYLRSITIPDSVIAIEMDLYLTYPEEFTVSGYDGTAAELFAKAHGYNFVCLNTDTRNILMTGTFGDNIQWTLYDNAEFVITGSGELSSYEFTSSVSGDWWQFRDCVRTLIIEEGITAIGSYSFEYMQNLFSIELPESLTEIGDSVFSECYSLNELTIPASVTVLGDGAFSYCDSLTAVYVEEGNPSYVSASGVLFDKDMTTLLLYPTEKSDSSYNIPEGVTAISIYAFSYNNDYLETLLIPASVTEIDNFHVLSNLTIQIHEDNPCFSSDSYGTIFNKNKTILYFFTSGNYRVREYTIPDCVETIADSAFSEAYSLEKITIPASVMEIGYNAFYAYNHTLCCYDGTYGEQYAKENGYEFILLDEDTVNIIDQGTCGDNLTWTLDENGLLTISGTGSMYDFPSNWDTPWHDDHSDSIRSLIVKEGVTSIGDYAFCGCKILTSVSLPEGITRFGDYTFYGCDPLDTLSIPASLASLGNQVFTYSSLESIDIADENQNFTADEYALFDKAKTVLYYYFSTNSSESYEIPSTVETIASGAFCECSNLSRLVVPESVVLFEEDAINSCYSLTDLTIYAKEAVFEGTVVNTPYYTTITAHDGSTAEFYAKDNGFTFIPLEGEDIPNTLASGECGETVVWTLYDTGELRISGTGAMTDYPYSSSAPWYDYDCRRKIQSVVIEDGITSVGDYAFYYCNNLTSITLADSVTSLGEYAFYDCYSLTSVPIPASVISIGESCFSSCDALTEILVDADNPAFTAENGVLYDKNKTILLNYPRQNPLTEYIIPETVMEIPNETFYSCDNLVHVTLPKTVTSIGWDNFYFCDNLTRVTAYGMETEIDSYTFRYNNSSFKLYCYEDSTYQNHAESYSIPYELLSKEESEEQIVTIHVADSSTKEAICGAMVSILSEGNTVRRTTGSSGQITLPLKNGIYTLQTIADGYAIRTVTVEISSSSTEFTVYMSGNSILQVETTVHELTREEAISAGIHIGAEENRQIYKCETILEFIPVPIVSYYAGDELIETTPYSENNIYVEEVAKNIFLVVHSEVGWLKEIFAVELIVTNTSSVEVVNDCEAMISVPDGMSLAVMTDEIGQQNTSVSLGTLAPEAYTKHLWYLTGDEAGEYILSGTVTGTRTGGGLTEKLQIPFTTREPITVLAGDAMKLTITAEKYATVGTPYRMKYTLKNVSDKTLYDVSMNVLGGKFFKAYSVEDLLYYPASTDASNLEGDFNNGYVLTDQTFLPEESLSGVFEITFASGIDADAIHYMLKDIFTITGAGSTTEIPTEIVLVDTMDIHSWGNRQIITEAACTEPGLVRYTCTAPGCSEMMEEKLPALGHAFASVRTVDIPVTCMESGESSYHCTRNGCDAKKDSVILPPRGHAYGTWTTVSEPTCMESGQEEHSCQRENCGFTETNVLPALGHDFSDKFTTDTAPTCMKPGEMSRHCSRCMERTDITAIPALGHTWDDGAVTQVPTAEEEGIYTYTCLVCGEKRTESIRKLGDVNRDGVTDNEDLQILNAYFAGYPGTLELISDLTAADVDGNPGVTRADVIYLARYLAGWPGNPIPAIP